MLLISLMCFKDTLIRSYPILLLLLLVTLIEFIIHSDYISGDDKFAYVMVLSVFIPQIIYIIFFISTVIYILKKYFSIYKRLFHISYIIFYILYFINLLFYYFTSNIDNLGEHYYWLFIIPILLIMPFQFIFTLLLIFKLYKDIQYIKRYLFIFIAVTIDIFLQISFFIDLFEYDIFINSNYYETYFCLIPLSFALIQLGVEMYSFYKKNRPKYIRYKRLLEYKNSKK